MNVQRERGFSVLEAIVATGLMLIVTASIFSHDAPRPRSVRGRA